MCNRSDYADSVMAAADLNSSSEPEIEEFLELLDAIEPADEEVRSSTGAYMNEIGTGVKEVILELYKNGVATGIKDTTDIDGKYLFAISDSASYQVKIISALPAGCCRHWPGRKQRPKLFRA